MTVGHKQLFLHIFLLLPFQFKISNLPAHNITYIACIGILYFMSRYESENFKLFLSYYYRHKIATDKKTKETTQPAITCSKLTIETLEQGVKYVQS